MAHLPNIEILPRALLAPVAHRRALERHGEARQRRQAERPGVAGEFLLAQRPGKLAEVRKQLQTVRLGQQFALFFSGVPSEEIEPAFSMPFRSHIESHNSTENR